MINVRDIQIRDPFIYCDPLSRKYYMYGTTDRDCWGGPGVGFDVYVSDDLQSWEGPFVEHSDGAVTPDEWECLDGTLFVDDGGNPWMVFCHEWQQVYDGKMCAARLSDDLSRMIGDPVVLFSASESGWAQEYEWQGKSGYITDGPCLMSYDGKMLMLWSSFIEDEYATGVAVSETGNIPGPWKHLPEPIYIGGGHGMVFEDFCGKKKMAFHQPNGSPDERAVFLDFDNMLNDIL